MLLADLFRQRGFLCRLPTPQQLADLDSPHLSCLAAESSLSDDELWKRKVEKKGPELLARAYLGMQSHRGAEVKVEGGPGALRTGAAQHVDARQWSWRTALAAVWRHPNEHKNVLEALALILSLRWR